MTLAFQKVSKCFGKFQALEDLDFSLNQGEAVAFLGVNGAGKTTAMRLLTGWLKADDGAVFVNDKPVEPGSPPSGIGYLPENNPLRLDRTVYETLLFAGRLLELPGDQLRQAIISVTETCQLHEMLSRSCGTLSKGMRQRVGLARALLGKPRVLLLDEPATGLDPNQSADIEALLRTLRGQVTMLVSTHRLHRLDHWCERVVLLHQGRVVFDGTPEAFLARAQTTMLLITDRPKTDVQALFNTLTDVGALTELEKENQWFRYRIACPEEARDDALSAMIAQGWHTKAWIAEPADPNRAFSTLTLGTHS